MAEGDPLRPRSLRLDGTEVERVLAPVDAEPLAEAAEDEVAAVPAEPVTRSGDLWRLGSHRLPCVHATKQEDVAWLMAGQPADMAWTDPPGREAS